MGSQQPQLPTINFNGLDLNQPFGSKWDQARTEVMAAFETYGCFDAIYGLVGPEVNEALFQSIMPELFALPLETKQMNKSNVYLGYIGQITDVEYESVRIQDAPNLESVENFARLLWPEGNRKFCNTITTYAQHVRNLEQMVETMIFQFLGIGKHLNSHIKKLIYGVRLSNYGGLPIEETKVSLPVHVDPNLITIVLQNGVEGLEVRTKDEEWLRVVPSPDTFTVMLGEAMTVLTNGRYHAPIHRVSVNQKRYSVLFSCFPKEGYLIQTPQDIVDEDHPLQFNPLDVTKYLKFKYSPEGLKAENSLKTFCGATIQTNKD
ncbi:2-oxoglutarate-dependent dioxygenase-related family protein [Rhynchospora pubera]|uniref:2-oxoglutarate-dependent dioxygenase-related family protein n=1 Tax=Rhynchospora pubera TaxID=906938 RepID=A0AAV8CVH2_9POAL|nr:2-oxoglutarate-dependent dioxygenase-related family protein [Rhynchospora pubera]